VLLIDDQPIVCEAVRLLLEPAEDVDLHVCLQSADALKEATRIRPDLVLLDMVMPQVDGLTLLRFFQRHPATRDVPVVILSATSDSDDRQSAFDAGAVDFLVKLPERDRLLTCIRTHANRDGGATSYS
jgi:PleD family two-component response regulator